MVSSGSGCTVHTPSNARVNDMSSDVGEELTAAPPDKGLQAERTALSWSRTSLAVVANALLVVRAGWVNERPGFALLGFVMLICSAATFVYGHKRRRDLTCHPVPSGPSFVAVTLISGLTLSACATAFAAILIGAPLIVSNL